MISIETAPTTLPHSPISVSASMQHATGTKKAARHLQCARQLSCLLIWIPGEQHASLDKSAAKSVEKERIARFDLPLQDSFLP